MINMDGRASDDLGLKVRSQLPDVLEDTDYSINVIGASSEEEDEIFVRTGLNPAKDTEKLVKRGRDDKMDEDDDEELPIDTGWAWMVLAGSFLNVTIMIGYARGLAMLFVEYLKLFEASTTKTTLLMGVLAGVYSFSSLITMNVLIYMIGIRWTALLGGTMTTLGMVMAIFPTSVTYLICTNSIFVGVGHSMIFGPAMVLIGQYFKKRRGLATAVAMSAVSFGSSVFPPLIRFLLDEYGVRGCMIILTGITMNMWVGAALYRPLSFYRKRRKLVKLKVFDSSKTTVIGSSKTTEKPKASNDVELRDVTKLRPEKFLSSNSVTSEILGRSPLQGYSVLTREFPDSPKIVRRLSRPLSTSGAISKRLSSIYSSHNELGSAPILNIIKDVSDDDTDVKPYTCRYYVKKIINILDFSLFKMTLFRLIITYSFFGITIGLLPVYIPAFCREKGISQDDAALFLMISGALDFFSRLFYGYLADLKVIPVNVIMALGLLVTGTVTHFAVFYDSYVSVLSFSIVVGLFSSSYFCLIPVAIIYILGVQNMPRTLGFVSVFHGISMAITHPILGSLKDYFGTYNVSFNYLGACAYMSALSLLSLPLIRRCSRQPNQLLQTEQVTEL